MKHGEFPGEPVVRTLCFHCRGPGFNRVQPLVGELRFHKLRGAAKKKNMKHNPEGGEGGGTGDQGQCPEVKPCHSGQRPPSLTPSAPVPRASWAGMWHEDPALVDPAYQPWPRCAAWLSIPSADCLCQVGLALS